MILSILLFFLGEIDEQKRTDLGMEIIVKIC